MVLFQQKKCTFQQNCPGKAKRSSYKFRGFNRLGVACIHLLIFVKDYSILFFIILQSLTNIIKTVPKHTVMSVYQHYMT